MKRGEKTKSSAPKYSRKNETPIAVISAAMRGASRSGLYATRSMVTARIAQMTMDSRMTLSEPIRTTSQAGIPGNTAAGHAASPNRDTAK